MIRILILAAGESRRMGQPKMLLPCSGATIIETVAVTALASSAEEVVVVLGAMEESIRQSITHLPVVIAVNTEFLLGMLSSIQCGIRTLPSDTDAVLLMLGDQPTVPVEVIEEVIAAWRSSGKGFVLPTYGGRRGHPLLIDLRHRDELLRLDPSAGMRAMLAAHVEDVLEVPVDAPAILTDIDTPEDYAALTGGSCINL
ncbi:MAG: nucleotidyltransferase family protein [Bacteroidota bacterium]|jgi:molybdenum cofactor cytidylyltransferase